MQRFIQVFVLLLFASTFTFTTAPVLHAQGKTVRQEEADIIRYGLETDISDMIKRLQTEENYEYSEEIFELFSKTRNTALKNTAINYFATAKDRRIADAAAQALADPAEFNNTTVSAFFNYASLLNIEQALPAVREILNDEESVYFDAALSCIGSIGQQADAAILHQILEDTGTTTARKQAVITVLGKLNAHLVEKGIAPDSESARILSEIAGDQDEDRYTRLYAARALGEMKNQNNLPVMLRLLEDTDVNFRTQILESLAVFEGVREAEDAVIQSIRDAAPRVRIAAIQAAKKMKISAAAPYLLARAKNDPDTGVKYAAFDAGASFGGKDINDFLVSIVVDKKGGETARTRAASALLANGSAGEAEIKTLALETLMDDKQKTLRYNLGKEIAKYDKAAFSDVCLAYLSSKDAATCGIGLDMYAKGKFSAAVETVRNLAADDKAGANQRKARRILGE